MSYPTVPDHMMKEMRAAKPVQKAVDTAMRRTRAVGKATTGFMDSLAFLIIAALYFFFTGLCLLLNRKLPRKWLQIGVDLDAGRISRKIEKKKEVIEKTDQVPEAKYKIVDIDSKKPVGMKMEHRA